MAEDAVELAFEGIHAAVEKIPDRHWNKVPGFGGPTSEDEQEPKQRRRRSNSQEKSSSKSARRKKPASDHDSRQDSHSRREDRNSREAVLSPDSPAHSYYTPEDSFWPLQNTTQSRPQDLYHPLRQNQPSVMRRYDPADYRPRGDQYYGYEEPPQVSARYQPTQAYDDDPYPLPATTGSHRHRQSQSEYDNRSRGRDSMRKPHKKKEESKSPSPSGIRGTMKQKIDNTFEASERGLATGALAALAGGLIGHQVGKGPLATVAGAVIGGLGGNAWEAKEHRHKIEQHRKRKERARARRARSEERAYHSEDDDRYGGSSNGYSGARGVGTAGDRGDDKSDEDDFPRRKHGKG